jgi:hypothetical protein
VAKSFIFQCTVAIVLFLISPTEARTLSDSEIRQKIIEDSVSSYPRNCPCPYNRARNGSSCGRRSAYSKVGGYAPLCYPDDVSDAMVQQYRLAHGLTTATISNNPISDNMIHQTQQALARLGYDPGPIDGIMGRRTRQAIEQFQQDQHLMVTGQPSTSLLRMLEAR